MEYKKLEDIGLNEKEARAYIAILELGEASMSELVNKSRLKRSTLYETVALLRERGLISL